MKTTRSARLLLAATTTVLLSTPGAALGFVADCAAEGEGSAVAAPEACDEDPEVLGVVEERPDDPAPDPEAAPDVAPETLTATGVDSAVLAAGALAAVGVGGAAVYASRRKSTPEA